MRISAWFAATLLSAFLVSCAPGYEVAVQNVSEPFPLGHEYQNGPTASIKQTIAIDGQIYKLPPTFDDPQAAIQWIREKAPSAIELLEQSYPWYGAFSESNWEQYQEALNDMLNRPDCPDWFNEGNDDVIALRGFFDIYENQKLNEELIESAQREGIEGVALQLGEPVPER